MCYGLFMQQCHNHFSSPIFHALVLMQVREATSNDPWGPSSSQMADLSDLTYNVVACNEIMTMLWKRLKDDRNWRHIHKVWLTSASSTALYVYCKHSLKLLCVFLLCLCFKKWFGNDISLFYVVSFKLVSDTFRVPVEDWWWSCAPENEGQYLHCESPHRVSLCRKGWERSGDQCFIIMHVNLNRAGLLCI